MGKMKSEEVHRVRIVTRNGRKYVVIPMKKYRRLIKIIDELLRILDQIFQLSV